MSRDIDSLYEDEYFEEIGRQEDIAAELKRLSEEPIRAYLGTYGDAIDERVTEVISAARYANQGGFPRFAILGAVTAIEIIIGHMLVRPLLQGAFLSNSWAQILTAHVLGGRAPLARKLLPSVLEMYDLKIDDLKLEDGSPLWQTFLSKVIPLRNAIAHAGERATQEQALVAIECAMTLRKELVAKVAIKLRFDFKNVSKWSEHVSDEGYTYDAASPF
ncbi:hypothetical protein [Bradyrhizobium yuanmingense]|uniref:hypothetical protein n=1 Tax=Bradyrhizobium yuanmingense TaxID=108015 RepID=UPI003513F683